LFVSNWNRALYDLPNPRRWLDPKQRADCVSSADSMTDYMALALCCGCTKKSVSDWWTG
jgi:hypothetical protein